MKFIYQYPERHGSDGDLLDAGDIAVVARAVESAGWDGLAFTEHPAPGARWLDAGGHQTLDPFVALAAAGAVTERITLLTYLAVLPYRNPFLVAKAATTIDRISGGRFILGVGTGYMKSEFFALGVDFEERNALFDEALDVLPLHWSGQPFSYEGRHFSARDVVGRPAPTGATIPIWIGGNARVTRRRVAERAQGWMPLIGGPEMSATTRTPHFGTMGELASAIAELRATASDRADSIEIVLPYPDSSVLQPDADVGHHRSLIAELEAIGVTWVAISGDTDTEVTTIESVNRGAERFVRS